MNRTSRSVLTQRNLFIIFSITLMAVMGVASITPAFPGIIDRFDLNTQQIGLLITVFTLPGIILTPFLGVLADRLGRKKVLVPSIMLFALAGSACTFVSQYETLLWFRFFQGIGAASIGSLNITLIGDLFSGKDRITAMGYNASVLSIGTAAYPAIGGGLAMIGWNFPFLLPLAGIPVGLWVVLSLKNPEPSNNRGLRDYLLNTARTFTDWQVAGLLLLNVMTFIILYGAMLTYFPVLLGDRFKAEPYEIGLIMSVSSLSTAVVASRTGWLSGFITRKQMLLLAMVIYAAALVVIPVMPRIWLMALPAVLFGSAQGINMPTLQTMLVGMAPVEYRAAFMSVNGMILRLGQTLGPIVIGLFFTAGGSAAAFFGAAGVAGLMFLIILFLIRRKQTD